MCLVGCCCFLTPPRRRVEYLYIADVSIARGTSFVISPALILPSEATVDYELIRKPSGVTMVGTRININADIDIEEYNIIVKATGKDNYSGETGATFKLNVIPQTAESCFGLSYGELTYNCDYINVAIPTSIGGRPVTHIAGYAFHNKNLSTVYLPDSVTHIGNLAFRGNNNLVSISMKSGTYYSTDGGYSVFEPSCTVANGCIILRP